MSPHARWIAAIGVGFGLAWLLGIAGGGNAAAQSSPAQYLDNYAVDCGLWVPVLTNEQPKAPAEDRMQNRLVLSGLVFQLKKALQLNMSSWRVKEIVFVIRQRSALLSYFTNTSSVTYEN